MRLLDREFTRIFIWPCLFSLVICVFLFLIADFFGLLDELIGYQPAVQTVILYLYYRFIYAVFFMLPLVVMLGSFWGLNSWRQSNQWTAVLNSGSSPASLLRVPLVTICLLTVAAIIFNILFIPSIIDRYKVLEDYQIPGETPPVESFQNLRFRMLDGSTVKIGKLLPEAGIAEDIVVMRHEEDLLAERIDAEEAQFNPDKGWQVKYPEVRDFESGRLAEITRPTEIFLALEPPGVLKKIMQANPRLGGRRPEEFTVEELRTAIRFRQRRGMNTTAEQLFYHWKVSYPLSIIVLAIIAIYLATGTRMSRPAGIGLLLLLALLYWAIFHMVLAYAKTDYFSLFSPYLPEYSPVYFTPGLFLFLGVYYWSNRFQALRSRCPSS